MNQTSVARRTELNFGRQALFMLVVVLAGDAHYKEVWRPKWAETPKEPRSWVCGARIGLIISAAAFKPGAVLKAAVNRDGSKD
jgi:hypothetical protein